MQPSLRDVPEHIRIRILPVDDGCWWWVGRMDQTGYGREGKRWAHRSLYELMVGPIPNGMQIDHLCRVKRCVNPDHLEVVTNRENFLRGDHPKAVLYRLNVCENGHSLIEHGGHNRGKRYCKECRRQKQRMAYQEQRWPSMVRKKYSHLYRKAKP